MSRSIPGTPIAILTTILAVLVGSQAVGEGRYEERLPKIAAIGYDGVDFSTTRQEFVAKFPNATFNDRASNAELGTTFYTLSGGRNVDIVNFEFLDDELLKIGFWCSIVRVRQIGGIDALTHKAKDRFGEPKVEHGPIALWEFPEIDRSITTARTGDIWALNVERLSVGKRLDDRKAQQESRKSQIDPGF
jgi:hypothetical protein